MIGPDVSGALGEFMYRMMKCFENPIYDPTFLLRCARWLSLVINGMLAACASPSLLIGD